MKDMRSALRKLRAEHSGKAVGKMNMEEIAKEIQHHEDACKHREMHEKRMAALKKAREARMAKKEKKEEPKKEKKQTEKDKEDEKLGEEVETIKSRMSKKKSAK